MMHDCKHRLIYTLGYCDNCSVTRMCKRVRECDEEVVYRLCLSCNGETVIDETACPKINNSMTTVGLQTLKCGEGQVAVGYKGELTTKDIKLGGTYNVTGRVTRVFQDGTFSVNVNDVWCCTETAPKIGDYLITNDAARKIHSIDGSGFTLDGGGYIYAEYAKSASEAEVKELEEKAKSKKLAQFSEADLFNEIAKRHVAKTNVNLNKV